MIFAPLVPAPPLCEAASAIARAARLSRYVQHALSNNPELETELAAGLNTPWSAADLRACLSTVVPGDEQALKTTLRQLRRRVMLRLITRDLAGWAGLNEVMQTASDLAEVSIDFCAGFLHRQLSQTYGHPIGEDSGAEQHLIVVGMGKLGGGELNVSSDIDLIFIYPEAGETSGPRRISNHEFFLYLGKRLIAALGDITGDGMAFRVDMRLRPHGDSGPLAVSLAMLEHYFETQGREWERYAWTKARVLTGDESALTPLLRPFVYRKYLDFGAFASMRDLHAQIREEVQRRDMHDNIKLGPGGIREVEFAAQVFQLIRGGRIAELQTRSTVTALEALRARELLPAASVDELLPAYAFLRNLEHRLQYLDDHQTQNLPTRTEDQTLIAEAMGFTDYPAFVTELDRHRNRVTRHFDQIFAAPQSEQGEHPLSPLWRGKIEAETARQQLEQLGYPNPAATLERLNSLRSSARYRQMTASAHARFDALLPVLIEIAAGFTDADATLARILDLLEAISRREAYLALLLEYPQTLSQVARLCSASPWVSAYLARHPVLLDELLDTRNLYARPDWAQRGAELHALLDAADGDTEQQMDILRNFKQTQTFRLVAQDLAGLLLLETLSDHLSDLADCCLKEVIRLCWQNLRNRHRDEPRFAIIGYGKLGGKELGYASDLDIIFLYEDDDERAAELYARLGQRISTWLTSVTAAGLLYETDLRLRPNGESGLLVSSIDAFRHYQENHAWVWEHQALTRARYSAGDPQTGQAFELIRRNVLMKPRHLPTLRQEVLAMRQKMLEAHPNPGPLFDLKHDRGGIIDVEFMVQYLVLGHAHQHPGLTRNAGNIALLGIAAEIGLIPAELAHPCADAYRDFRKRQHQSRLQGAEKSRVPPQDVEPETAAVRELWQAIFSETQRM